MCLPDEGARLALKTATCDSLVQLGWRRMDGRQEEMNIDVALYLLAQLGQGAPGSLGLAFLRAGAPEPVFMVASRPPADYADATTQKHLLLSPDCAICPA